MKNLFLTTITLAGLAAGLVLLQTAGYPPRAHAQTLAGQREGRLFDFLAAHLDLSDAQKQQAKAILEAARQQAMPAAAQLKQGHQAMAGAVKSGQPDSELDRLAAQQGQTAGQLSAIHARTASRIYALLTPEQKAKADELHEMFRTWLAERIGMRH